MRIPFCKIIQSFFIALKKIKSSDRTENILIRSTGFEETDPYIETMYIIGDYTLPEIQEMVKELTPSEVYENWMYGKPVNAPEPNGKVFSMLPKLDQTKSWTDEEIYKFFNLTDTEIEIIEDYIAK